MFRQAVERTPERDALVDLESGKRYSYRELQETVHTVANSLSSMGIGHGDRIAIGLRNRPEHVFTFLATQAIGAVAVPFNFRLERAGIETVLEDASPELLIYGDEIGAVISRDDTDLSVERSVAVDGDDSTSVSFDELLDGSSSLSAVEVEPDDQSVVLYSSGTTGEPKGIKITHLATGSRVLLNTFGQRFRMSEERVLGVMPLYHTVGLHGILCNMMALSGTYVCVPHFDPDRVVRTIEREAITALHEVPTIFRAIVETNVIERTDTGSVRIVTYSGEPMETSLLETVKDQFDPEFLSNQYGLTEAFGPLDQTNLRHGGDPSTTGPSNILQETRIVEMESKDPEAVVESPRTGELIVSMDSPTMFSGYLNKPEETERAIRDGWFFTGDVAYRDETGRTVITGRVDDMIISGGENIYPAEVEDVLAAHEAVDAVAVVGVPHEQWGEVPKAYVKTTSAVTEATLDQWCRDSQTLANFKRPREYAFVDELPRNASGKILRYHLRENEA
jgi:2-furoate---CoA ligase